MTFENRFSSFSPRKRAYLLESAKNTNGETLLGRNKNNHVNILQLQIKFIILY